MITKRGSFVVSLVVLVLSLLGSTALFAQDVVATLLARGYFEDGKLTIEVKEPVDVAQLNVTMRPGGQIDWHYHPGYEIFIVKTGVVTEYLDQPGCPKNVYTAGSVFFSGESHVHKIVNGTEGTTEFFPTFIVPPDSPTIFFVDPVHCDK